MLLRFTGDVIHSIDASIFQSAAHHFAVLKILNAGWWYMPVIPTFRRLREEDCEFKASLGYRVRSCLQKNHSIGLATL
jgi:hypothetical protein